MKKIILAAALAVAGSAVSADNAYYQKIVDAGAKVGKLFTQDELAQVRDAAYAPNDLLENLQTAQENYGTCTPGSIGCAESLDSYITALEEWADDGGSVSTGTFDATAGIDKAFSLLSTELNAKITSIETAVTDVTGTVGTVLGAVITDATDGTLTAKSQAGLDLYQIAINGQSTADNKLTTGFTLKQGTD